MTENDNKFMGEVSAQSLADVLQFYVMAGSTVKLIINYTNSSGKEEQGYIWINKGRVIHAITNNNFGIDAFYELLSHPKGEFESVLNSLPETESISKPWSELILEYYVLSDEGKLPDEPINVRASVVSKEKNDKSRFTNPDIDPVKELDFSDLNEVINSPKIQKKTSKPNFRSYRDKIKPLLDLDGFIAASIVSLKTGMSLVEECHSKEINLVAYSAYMVELIKANFKFLDTLEINEKIEDIIINLDKKYHIVTFVNKNEEIFIYLILDKEASNLAISRIVLAEVESDIL